MNALSGLLDKVSVRILDPRLGGEFPLPSYATEGAAGMDLRALPEQDTVLAPGETVLFPTGLAIAIGNPQCCAAVVPRSGLGTRYGIVLGNLTGIIDADYEGPLLIPLWNRSSASFTVTVGMRVAQLIFLPVLRPRLEVVSAFAGTTRGTGGFGSTGL